MRRIPPFIAVLLLATALRAGVVLVRGVDREPVKDEWSYARIAENIAAGDGIWFEVTREVGGEPVTRRLSSLRPPLYPVVLAALFRVFGDGSETVIAGRLFSAICGALAAALFFGWARSVVGTRVGLLAALAFAAWPAHLWASSEMLTEPLFSLLLCGAMWALTACRPLPAGMLLGLAVLTRPSALLFLLPAWLFLLVRRAGEGRKLPALLALTLPVLVLVAPWVVRNAGIHGRPLLTTNLGVTFLGGNSELSLTASPPGRWHLPEDVLADAPPPLGYYGWPELSELENNRRFLSLGLAWVREHPGLWARLVFHKAVRFFDPDQHSVKADRGLKRVAGWVSFGPLLVLFLIGMGPSFSRYGRGMILPFGLVAVQLATALLFYGDARVRLPAIPGFLIPGMVGAVWFVVRLRGSRGASRGPDAA
jgi:4-amino-4-deoxy-L-arabinose transferase-like glycosyltransferase